MDEDNSSGEYLITNNDFKILHKINIPSKGLSNNKIDNFDLIFEMLFDFCKISLVEITCSQNDNLIN